MIYMSYHRYMKTIGFSVTWIVLVAAMACAQGPVHSGDASESNKVARAARLEALRIEAKEHAQKVKESKKQAEGEVAILNKLRKLRDGAEGIDRDTLDVRVDEQWELAAATTLKQLALEEEVDRIEAKVRDLSERVEMETLHDGIDRLSKQIVVERAEVDRLMEKWRKGRGDLINIAVDLRLYREDYDEAKRAASELEPSMPKEIRADADERVKSAHEEVKIYFTKYIIEIINYKILDIKIKLKQNDLFEREVDLNVLIVKLKSLEHQRSRHH